MRDSLRRAWRPTPSAHRAGLQPAMMGQGQGFMLSLVLTVLFYFACIVGLAWLGYRQTATATDYLVAGRKMHPFVMAMSYGSAFVSTSAIVGFGGVAAVYGMSILWLVFLNILAGVFIAFLVFGEPTRRMGKRLGARTFPEFLGRRFESRFIQVFAGAFIFLFMPLYAGVILIGAAKFLEQYLAVGHYNMALIGFSVLVLVYVITGGLKGMMYADAFQGSIMFFGMALLMIMTYVKLGGFVGAHSALTAMEDKVPEFLAARGHQGWTRMPAFGSEYWWVMVSTIILGVGIGVLAQPQLAVRFMTVKGKTELNRAVMVGGVFMLMIPGAAYMTGALSNVYFLEMTEHKDIALVAAGMDVERIIPLYISEAMPRWFGNIFLVTLLAAALSTASSQFHAMGSALGHDVINSLLGRNERPVLLTRVGIFISFLISVSIAWILPMVFGVSATAIIARGTAIFFGLCAATFLPVYAGALFWPRVGRRAAIASMVSGFAASAFWLVFIHFRESSVLLISNLLFGKPSLAMTQGADGTWEPVITGFIRWIDVDPLVVATPLSLIVLVVATLLFERPAPAPARACR